MVENNHNEHYNHEVPDREQHTTSPDYIEETAAEIAPPPYGIASVEEREVGKTGGRGIGITALIISIISLFIMPIFLGIVGIVVGFVARSKGAVSLGTWAISLGAISIIVAIFIAPFF